MGHWLTRPRLRPSPRVVGFACLGATASCTAGSIVTGDAPPIVVRFLLVLTAFVSFGALFIRPVRAAVLTKSRIVAVSAALLLVAVAVSPVGHDMWSYAMYGRIVSAHHASPYTHVPADYPHDPLLPLVGWRHTPSVYGPGFVALAAAGTSVAGSSPLANRLFFQGIEALALAAAMVLVWRRTRDPAALAFVGLNPALFAVVTDGHNDMLVGLAVLAGALLIADERPYAAGVVLAAGALVKIVVLLPLAALVVWAWYRWGRTKALVMAAVGGGVVIAAYAIAGGTAALEPVLGAAGARTSRSSIWGLPGLAGIQHSALPLAVLAGIAAGVILLSRRSASAAWLAGAVVLAFLLTAQYVLPWYVAWGLPALALVWRSRLAMLAAAQAALLALAYVPVRGTAGMWRVYYAGVVPACSVAGIIALVVLSVRQSGLRGPAPRSGEDRGAAAHEVAG
jgi:hypothetical protein